VLEVILVAAVIFHALNGIRIIVIDYWPQGARHQQQLLRGVIVLWLALLVPTLYYLLKFSFLTVFGS
jgi:succinate dehydrogenase / fumarate reductase cytochrome b subunit